MTGRPVARDGPDRAKMMPFGTIPSFYACIALFLWGPGLPITAGPVKPTRIGRGTRALAQLFCAKQHGRLGRGSPAKMIPIAVTAERQEY